MRADNISLTAARQSAPRTKACKNTSESSMYCLSCSTKLLGPINDAEDDHEWLEVVECKEVECKEVECKEFACKEGECKDEDCNEVE